MPQPKSTPIEGKGLPVVECPVAVNIFMATNHEHAAHVEWGDMRYWILAVSKHRRGDSSYWAPLREEINNGGIEAFLHDLLTRDVSKFEPQRDVPLDNAEHRANKHASDPANPALWLMDCLDNGLWLGSEKWEGAYSADEGSLVKLNKSALPIAHGAKVLPAFLDCSYRAWATTQGPHAQAASKGKFWKQLTKFGFVNPKSNGVRHRIVPAEGKLRAKIIERLGEDDADDIGEVEV